MSELVTPSPISILYQDEEILIVDKPSGLLVHRSRESADTEFLVQKLRDQIGGKWVFPVHRLDRGASGALSLALSSESAAGLQASLKHPMTRKLYLTLVRGEAPEKLDLQGPLTSHETGELQEARSRFRRIETFRVERDGRQWPLSLLEVEIETGRRHQIRRHLARTGHFVLGDTVYGKGPINRHYREHYRLNRLFLHCHRLSLSGGPDVHAPLPPGLELVLELLRAAPTGAGKKPFASALGHDNL